MLASSALSWSVHAAKPRDASSRVRKLLASSDYMIQHVYKTLSVCTDWTRKNLLNATAQTLLEHVIDAQGSPHWLLLLPLTNEHLACQLYQETDHFQTASLAISPWTRRYSRIA